MLFIYINLTSRPQTKQYPNTIQPSIKFLVLLVFIIYMELFRVISNLTHAKLLFSPKHGTTHFQKYIFVIFSEIYVF